MTMTGMGLSLVLLACGLGFVADRAMADESAGAAQFVKSCGTCHANTKNAGPRQGPNLWKVVGRKAGTQKGFKYSPAFKAGSADITWEEASIDRWITNPQAMIPGVVMMYKQADPDKRKVIIDYLKTLQ
jgi:cytochrome c